MVAVASFGAFGAATARGLVADCAVAKVEELRARCESLMKLDVSLASAADGMAFLERKRETRAREPQFRQSQLF